MVAATLPQQPSVQVQVQPAGVIVEAVPGAVLLDVLLAAGVPVSYSCQAGRCGTCRCELVSGDVAEDAAEFRNGPPLTQARQVLACRTRLTGNCIIRLSDSDEVVLHPAQTLKCRVTAVEKLNHITLALQLRPNRALSFSAGQFANLDFGMGLVRPYSMANPEKSETLEFHLRLVPGGRVTSFVAANVRAGHSVKLIGPLGTSYVRRKHMGPVLCVAGGTGLAPIASIVRTSLSIGTQGPLHLYVGARVERDLYGIEDLRTLEREHSGRLKVTVAVDSDSRDPTVRQGMVTNIVREDLSSLKDWKVYLAGPPPMVEAGARLAVQLRARGDDIHADAFYPSEN